MAEATIALKGRASDFAELTWRRAWGWRCSSPILVLQSSPPITPSPAPAPRVPGLGFQQPHPSPIGSQHAAACLKLLWVPRPPYNILLLGWHSGPAGPSSILCLLGSRLLAAPRNPKSSPCPSSKGSEAQVGPLPGEERGWPATL